MGLPLKSLFSLLINQSIYIYIYKQRPHVRRDYILSCDTLIEKIIEIFLNYKIRTKKKNIDFLFLWFNISRLPIKE